MNRPIIVHDAHMHFGPRGPIEAAALTSPLRDRFPAYKTMQFSRMEDYESQFEAHHVEKAVLVPFVLKEPGLETQTNWCLDYARQHPGRFYPYALIDDDDPDYVERHYGELVGLKQHIILHETEVTSARREMFALLQEHGLVLLLHTHSDKRVQYVTEIVRDFPHLKIQVAHMGRAKADNVPFMREIIETFAPFENVFFDTSTIRIPEVVTMAVRKIGAERVLYGSDFPFFMDETGEEDVMQAQIDHILRAEITDRQRELIFRENFDRLITFGK
ncbi:MAG: amidohydrolase [Ruminococcaceae bacterium]|nr:amidohydrolase [Oscillospiraceae bacterium]